ncbi:MAG: hypothetical protein F4Z71_02935 [Gammaproteobacteria bacterium]|nr:hypothetical protein [Gammaproteobacteria bacterium]MYE28746.1 hypothetical protein [Gammaproteobacteria bacterium]
MKKLAVALLALLTPIAAAQDPSSSTFTENAQEYGNCFVGDQVDMFTDAVSHVLACSESTLTDKTTIMFMAFPVNGRYWPAVHISKGVQINFEDSVEVAIRVDRGELLTGEWTAVGSGDAACYPMPNPSTHCNLELFHRLLIDVANGERIAIRVGRESGNALLEGSYEAVADFLERVQDKIPTIILPIED